MLQLEHMILHEVQVYEEILSRQTGRLVQMLEIEIVEVVQYISVELYMMEDMEGVQ
jgi:hypothetical protein